ncbi:MAG: hypothetical protein AAF203_09030 [Pseudomonadota bacterium]
MFLFSQQSPRTITALFILFFGIQGHAEHTEAYERLPPCPLSFSPQPKADVYKELLQKFEEVEVGHGLNRGGALVSIYLNKESGSWTYVVTLPDGTADAISGGTRMIKETTQTGFKYYGMYQEDSPIAFMMDVREDGSWESFGISTENLEKHCRVDLHGTDFTEITSESAKPGIGI